METIQINRFKVYRKLRWLRTEYVWSEENPYLKQYKLDVRRDSNLPCDILAIPCPHVPDHEKWVHRDDGLNISKIHRGLLDYQDTPMICDSSMDYAYLDSAMLSLLSHPQVRFFMPNVAYRDLKLQRRKAWCSEYHGHAYECRNLHETGPETKYDRPQLPAEIIAKLRPAARPVTELFPDPVYEYIARKIKPLSQRPVDLFFAGRTRYFAEFPAMMRTHLTKLWHRWPGNNKVLLDYHDGARTQKHGQPIKAFDYPFEYVDQLLEAKVVVSPWGFSPWCIRDLEALLCGCIVVKPECSNILIYPDIYDPTKQFMVWCDIMYQHLEGQLEYIYRHLDEMQDRVDRGRQFILDAIYPRDKVLAAWAKTIREMSEACLNRPGYSSSTSIPHDRQR